MPRKEPAKGIHTSPKNAGKNINPDNYTKDKEDDGLVSKLLEVFDKGQEHSKTYKGLWTEETFIEAVHNYFVYCSETSLKPNKAGLRLWLGVSRAQYYDWASKPDKYKYKSDILDYAHALMEDSYVNRGEKYPTMNTFLLKTSHGHVEASKLDITTNGQSIGANENEVQDLVSKLGLDQ